jgi:hypothetical protein
MNRRLIALLLSAFLVLGLSTVTGHGQEKSRKGFLSILKEGQSISVREVGGRYEITFIKGVQPGHKIVEVGADYLVVEDIAGVTETRIPIYSIKSIVRVKVPKE